jgi:hypothetical protein
MLDNDLVSLFTLRLRDLQSRVTCKVENDAIELHTQ